MGYLQLTFAIIFELIGTTLLKKSNGFTDTIYSIGTLVSYSVCFYLLSKVMTVIPVGIAYAIWSAVGLVLVSLVGIFLFGERPDTPAILGLILIISGVVIINLFSKMSVH